MVVNDFEIFLIDDTFSFQRVQNLVFNVQMKMKKKRIRTGPAVYLISYF